jgi:integrase
MAWTEAYKNGYRGRYKDAAGKNRTAGAAKTKRAALALARDQEETIRRGSWVDPDAGKMTFADYFENHWVVSRPVEGNTLDGYRSHYRSALRDRFGPVPLAKITSGMVQDWVTDLAQAGVAPCTVRAKYRTLSTVLGARRGRSAVRDRRIHENPCVGVQLPTAPPREVSIYRPEELHLLRTHFPPWWQPMIDVAIEAGLRWGELIALEARDLDAGERRLVVRRTIVERRISETGNGTRFQAKPYPKSTKPRSLRISMALQQVLQSRIDDQGLAAEDRLFPMPSITLDGWVSQRTEAWPQGLPVSRSYFRESVWRKAQRAAGVRQLRFHDVRASNISWLVNQKASLPVVMQRVGHSDLATTRRYLNVLDAAEEEAVELLADLWGSRAKAAPAAGAGIIPLFGRRGSDHSGPRQRDVVLPNVADAPAPQEL